MRLNASSKGVSGSRVTLCMLSDAAWGIRSMISGCLVSTKHASNFHKLTFSRIPTRLLIPFRLIRIHHYLLLLLLLLRFRFAGSFDDLHFLHSRLFSFNAPLPLSTLFYHF